MIIVVVYIVVVVLALTDGEDEIDYEEIPKSKYSSSARDLVSEQYEKVPNKTVMSKKGLMHLASNEGYVGGKVYTDQVDCQTVGIGLNLVEGNTLAEKVFEDHSKYSISEVRNGEQLVSRRDVYSMFQSGVNYVTDDCKHQIKGFNELPQEGKDVVINVAYQQGINRLKKNFKDVIKVVRKAKEGGYSNQALLEAVKSNKEWRSKHQQRVKSIEEILE